MNVRPLPRPATLAVLAFFGWATSAAATTLTFEDLAHGQIVTTQYVGLGVTIHAVNPNRSFDLASVFDTRATGTDDPDLEDPFDGGNAMNTVLGNVLIVSESDEDPDHLGFVERPDDEGQRPAGRLFFDFATPQDILGFDFLDIERGPEVDGSKIEFFSGATLVSTVQFAALQSVTPSIVFGDNYANHVDPFSVGGSWDRVVFHMGGSGSIDNIDFTRTTPEPGAGLLLALGGAVLVRVRRRGRQARVLVKRSGMTRLVLPAKTL